MQFETFARHLHLPVPPEVVFRWHMRPETFARLLPPWEPVEIIDMSEGVKEGSRGRLAVSMGPVRKTWVAEHHDIVPNRQFRDVQISGPFSHWVHTHSFIPDGAGGCFQEDHIEYALPLGTLGRFIGRDFVRDKLERLFAWRHQVTAQDIALHQTYPGVTPMNILVSGSTGLVGNALVPFLTTSGHEVIRLVRSKSRTPARELVHWDPSANYVDAAGLEGLDCIVHLAGESIASGRWTDAKKHRIRDSRVKGTRLLCDALSHTQRPPSTLICASAIGYYGDRKDERLTEKSGPGTGFLPEVCQEWEAATEPARQKGIRVVNLRFGVILSPVGGALQKMLPPFRFGAGGVLGDGHQYMSWIALDDVTGAILHALTTPTLTGPVNTVAPNPARNYDFTKTLGKVLNRPTIFPMPAFAARLAFGEMADALLLSSTRVVPERLEETGFKFQYPELEPTLRHLLGKPA